MNECPDVHSTTEEMTSSFDRPNELAVILAAPGMTTNNLRDWPRKQVMLWSLYVKCYKGVFILAHTINKGSTVTLNTTKPAQC